MRLRTFVPAIVILLLSTLATGVVAWSVNRSIKISGQQQFEIQTASIASTIAKIMAAYEQVIRAGGGLHDAFPAVTREQWHTFVEAQKLEQSFPGIQGLGLVDVIRPADLAAHVAQQRRLGRDGYEVKPPGPRDLYSAIVILEPEDERNARAIGFDMFSEDVRRSAMDRARDTGDPALTRHVQLIQEDGVDVQKGAVMYYALYDRLKPLQTSAQKQDALVGYVFAAFRMRDLFSKMLGKHAPWQMRNSRVEVFDGVTSSNDSLLYDSASSNTPVSPRGRAFKPLFGTRQPIDVAGQTWLLRAESTAEFEAQLPWNRPWLVAGVGGLLSALVSGIAASLNYSRDRSLEAERVLAAEVEQRRRAQEDVQLANRELIHRVKNIIAVVTSIAAQTARYSNSLDDFNVAFRDRMAGLGRVHDLLRPNPAFAPELGNFLREVLKPYCADNETKLEAQGPQVDIPRQTAVLLSLLINELATNATKYGAWSVPAGKVTLIWQLREAPEDQPDVLQVVALSWTESDGPQVTPPSRSGFGTNVMKFAIERGLGGKIKADYRPAGFCCAIEIPVKRQDEEALSAT